MKLYNLIKLLNGNSMTISKLRINCMDIDYHDCDYLFYYTTLFLHLLLISGI